MENRDAFGYKPVGFVNTLEGAQELATRRFLEPQGWPLQYANNGDPVPEYRYKEVKRLLTPIELPGDESELLRAFGVESEVSIIYSKVDTQVTQQIGEHYREIDPVFEDPDGGDWWFYDETWSDAIGPFDSREDAERGLRHYCHYMGLYTQTFKHRIIHRLYRIFYPLWWKFTRWLDNPRG